jgi:uncharacterized protein (UPF0276 family)
MLDTSIYREKLCKTWITATMHGNDISKTFAGNPVKRIAEIFVSEHKDDGAGGPLLDMDYRLRGNDMGLAMVDWRRLSGTKTVWGKLCEGRD